MITIYTDGSALGNPGPGGYGIVLRFGDKVKEISGGFRNTTNNRMELLAIVEALKSLKTKKYPIHIYSDSKYVIDSITKGWLSGWVKKGFKGKKNVDLWKQYLQVSKGYDLNFHWVKGHAGNPDNERCDRLAVAKAENGPHLIDEGFENRTSDSDLFR
ncbi:ribonuclease HI [Marivirga sp.]|uniref:ribonuclease HI n=1 Tax=Marivirga sp. TaxID=2018662 RepID=UPI002D7EDB71|nr:ribonuclease HI [Marivirga sp.]HET8860167.1 ribonuclease HI [Marivirga sp.]